ncbi:MAG: hypothetical protein A4E44_01953 [Methanosaeta sp. PtaB.Bin018]|nr:MAG: hypothetical protein A4E44_01953 [Methanosaeta sp. PtaB.Bin018]OPY46732.1 MAG: hypothetical protein A4E46_00790 [Methanosaeta sp. PtaU1.Bin016]
MVSKHPQDVWGASKNVYSFMTLYSPPERFSAISLIAAYSPAIGSMAVSLGIGNWGPSGSTLAAARPSNQVMAPHKDGRSGVTTQALVGANAWHSVQP